MNRLSLPCYKLLILERYAEGRTNGAGGNDYDAAAVEDAADVADARRAATVEAARTEPPPSVAISCICTIFNYICSRHSFAVIIARE